MNKNPATQTAYKHSRGFTLIELLIVIVIIGILAGIVLVVLNPAKQQRKSAESVLKANTNKVCLAMYSCAQTSGSAADCNSKPKLDITGDLNPDDTPVNAVYAVSGADKVTVTGTLPAGTGSTTSCIYTCSYTFSTGATTKLAESGTGCL